MSRNSESKFQVHLSSTKAMFQYMTVIEKQLQSPALCSSLEQLTFLGLKELLNYKL